LRVRCLKIPAGDQGLRGFWHLTFLEDTTEKFESEQHLEDWRTMVAHDLRSPISRVIATFYILQGVPQGQGLSAAENDLVGAGVRSCQRMLELLRLYLDLARLEAGWEPAVLSSVNLSRLVRRCMEEHEPMALAKSVEIMEDIPLDFWVRAEPDTLHRVVGNLLHNAIKFTPKAGRVKVWAKREGFKTRLLVEDTGPGIAEEDRARIFDRRLQAELRRKGRLEGSGLGLAFCREAMRAMRGGVLVESQKDRGSAFILEFETPDGQGG
jgi:signal transduction histidine kinase